MATALDVHAAVGAIVVTECAKICLVSTGAYPECMTVCTGALEAAAEYQVSDCAADVAFAHSAGGAPCSTEELLQCLSERIAGAFTSRSDRTTPERSTPVDACHSS